MEFLRSKGISVTVVLSDVTGTPLLGLGTSDLRVVLKKHRRYVESTLHTPYIKTLTSDNFREIDDQLMPGAYEIDLTPLDTNTLGPLLMVIQEDNASGVVQQNLTFLVKSAPQNTVPNIVKLENVPVSSSIPIAPRRGESRTSSYLADTIGLRVSQAGAINSTYKILTRDTWSEFLDETGGTYRITIDDALSVGTHTFEIQRGDLSVPLLDGFVTYVDGTESSGDGFGSNLQDLFFESEHVGWAIIRKPTSTILYTTDGGGTWVPITDPVVSGATNLNVIDGAYDVGDNAYHIFTAGDGPNIYWWDGSVWSVLTSDATVTGRCLDIHARTSDDVWFVGGTTSNDYNGRFISRWNGISMSLVTLPANTPAEDDSVAGDALYSVYSTSLDVVHVCGGGRYARSINGGSTWNDLVSTSLSIGAARSLHFLTSSEGFLLGTSGLLRTTTGGSSWSSFSFIPSGGGIGVRCLSPKTGTVLVTTTQNIWHVTGSDWRRISEYGGEGISFVGDTGTTMPTQKLRIAAKTLFLDNVTNEVLEPSGYHFTVNVTNDIPTSLSDIYVDTQTIVPLVQELKARDVALCAVVNEGSTISFTTTLKDLLGDVVGVTNIEYEFFKNGSPVAGTLVLTEIGDGRYSVGIPSELTETAGDLVLTLVPGEGSSVNWVYESIEPVVDREYTFRAISTYRTGATFYGFQAGYYYDGNLWGWVPTAYYTNDFVTWQEDLDFLSLGLYSDDSVEIKARTEMVGSNLVTAVIVQDWSGSANALAVKLNSSLWQSYAISFTAGTSTAVTIEDVDKIWTGSSNGEIGLWNGVSHTEISSYPTTNFSDMVFHNGNLWITTWEGSLLEYDIGLDTFSDITSLLPTKASETALVAISKKGTTILVSAEDGIWLSTNDGSTFTKQTFPISGTDFFGDPFDPNMQEYQSLGFFGDIPLISNGSAVLAYINGTWEVGSSDPVFDDTNGITSLSKDGYGAVDYDTSNVSVGRWSPPTLDFFEKTFRVAVVPSGSDLTPVLDSIAEVKGVGFNTATDSLLAVRTAVDSIDTGSVDLTPILDSIAEVKGVGFNTTTDSLLAVRTAIDSIDTGSVDLTPILDSIAEVKGAGFDTAEDSLVASKGRLESITEALARNLGLSQENLRISGQQYDGNGNLIASVIKIYPSGADVVADTNPIAEYTLTVAYDANNRLVDYQFVRT